MAAPNALTRILTSVNQVDDKVDALQAQVAGLEEQIQPLAALSVQLTAVDDKVTDVLTILNGPDLPDLPDPPIELGLAARRASRKPKA